ncbi:MAG: site-2 protease family protein [Candidatus Eremiobacteraeota bacterium]|nr:site-2 protease family protein [Candidatus Eremiobacteraeota bacterium]
MRIASVFGIEISVSLSWIFVFAFVAWSLADPTGPLHRTELGIAARIALGVVGSVLFFASVLVHELAHSLVARARGIRVRGIMLFIFGGVSQFEDEPKDAPGEAWISAVGPLMSLVVGALFFGFAQALGSTTIGVLFAYLAYVNVVLAIFNLIPAYPLDGGRVLHSLVWRISGSRERATSITVTIGRILASAIVAFGIFEALAYNVGAGLWTTLIGWFLLQAGSAEQTRIAMSRAMQGRTAGELAVSPEFSISADARGIDALEAFRHTGLRTLPVTLGDRVLGLLSYDTVSRLPDDELERSYVTGLMTHVEDLDEVPATTSAAGAIEHLANKAHAVALTNSQGTATAVVTPESVMRWLGGYRS